MALPIGNSTDRNETCENVFGSITLQKISRMIVAIQIGAKRVANSRSLRMVRTSNRRPWLRATTFALAMSCDTVIPNPSAVVAPSERFPDPAHQIIYDLLG